MGEDNHTIVIRKRTLIIICLILVGVGAFIVWSNSQEKDVEENIAQDSEVEDINLDSLKEDFDRDEAIEKVSEDAYYDCYDKIIKLNPTRTSSEDLEYFREVCKIQQRDYALSLEEYDDSFLEYLLSPEGRKALRELREDSKD